MTTTDAPNARFCVRCKWAADLNRTASFWRCHAPQNTIVTSVSPLTGEPSENRTWIYCETLRQLCSDNSCAPEGRWFEPREIEVREAAE